ncbi:hypothetical protein D9V37_18135 [Nocardioides mangrovicus]|uniref:Uncharacterized protein n=2 Tax=Nocardioides mangrovicus TaxID=2478913 RepID=A0A3L8P0C0_9ACTN|nr:hypothetical protein D9V37_18135 [Nocardioides mangrovicus]
MTVLAVLSVLAGVAGCGQQPSGSARSEGSSSPSSSSSGDAAASQSWLLRFDSYVGEDGEGRQATYVTLTPATGTATVVTMRPVEPMQASGGAVSLLVDASHRWALLDSKPQATSDRAKGVVRLYDLSANGAKRAVSVRRLSHDPSLRTDWVSFDPTDAGVLRVVSGRTVWKVDLATQQAQQEGTLPQKTGWIYGGGFAQNTGEPFIEDTGSFETIPAGNGEDSTEPVQRAGGRVLDPLGDEPYGDAPSPCEVSAGFVTSGGDTWAFCVAGRTLQTKVLDEGSSTWRDVGQPTSDVVPTDSDPVFVLPPTQG